MKPRKYINVSNLILGNILAEVPFIKDYSETPTILIQNSVKDNEIIRKFLGNFQESEIIYSGSQDLDENLSRNINCLVVIGGGSLIDVAKYYYKSIQYLIIIPTTYCDAAVTNISTYNPEMNQHLTRRIQGIDAVIVDYKLLEEVAPSNSLECGLWDAYSHIYEYNNFKGEYTTTYYPDDEDMILEKLSPSLLYNFGKWFDKESFSSEKEKLDILDIIFRIAPMFYQNGHIGLPHSLAPIISDLTGLPHGKAVAIGILISEDLLQSKGYSYNYYDAMNSPEDPSEVKGYFRKVLSERDDVVAKQLGYIKEITADITDENIKDIILKLKINPTGINSVTAIPFLWTRLEIALRFYLIEYRNDFSD